MLPLHGFSKKAQNKKRKSSILENKPSYEFLLNKCKGIF